MLLIIVSIVLIGGGAYLLSSNERAASPTQDGSEQQPNAALSQTDSLTDESSESSTNNNDERVASRYVDYSKTALDSSTSKRRVLYFYATWCPTCKVANTDFQTNTDKIPEDVIVIRTNYNDSDTDQEEKDLARKYGITYQHTFVQIDGQGNELTTWNGGQLEELLENVK